jgi:two-component system, NtrC family, sensor kinase
MDLKGDEEYYSDIVEIEKGIQKCKVIVQNLLGFSRVDDFSEDRKLELSDVIQRAILIVELRTRALGIKIDFHPTFTAKVYIQGRFNQLAHAICNILQNSYESIIEKRKTTPAYSGTIEIKMSEIENTVHVDILDDGKGIAVAHIHHVFDPLFTTKDPAKHAGLGLTLARQILLDHSSSVSVSSQKDDRTCCSIRFPRITHLA